MLLTTMMLTAAITTGQPAEPTPKEVKRVVEYYYDGQDPIFADFFLCKTVEKKDKATKYDCIERFGSSAKKGERVNVYMMAMVPRNTKATYMIQASHEGVVRNTRDIKLSGGIRSRTWRGFTVSKPGKWEFKLLADDGSVLKTLSIEARDE